MRRIGVELSSRSVREAVRELTAYRDSLATRLERLLSELSAIGVAAAVAVVPYDTGELLSGIRLERLGERDFLVVADCGYAAFVEFGTGVVGQGTYQGELPPGWSYDERRTPAAHDPEDPTRWYYYDRDGVLRATRGQRAAGFMAAASEEMRQAVLAKAREVFSS